MSITSVGALHLGDIDCRGARRGKISFDEVFFTNIYTLSWEGVGRMNRREISGRCVLCCVLCSENPTYALQHYTTALQRPHTISNIKYRRIDFEIF